MRRNGHRAVSLGVMAVTVSLTGSLLSHATSSAAPTSSGSRAATKQSLSTNPFTTDARRKRLKAMRKSTSKSVKLKNVGGIGNRPNVIVLMADDMRADDLNKPWMRNTRKLIAGNGATFTNSFAPTPLCAPARASFLTGKYVHNHGVRAVREPYGFQSFRDGNTLPVWLRAAGYKTIFLGKYINGYGRQPTRWGQPSKTYIPPGWSDWRASLDSKGTYNYFNTHLNRNGKEQSLAGRYQTSQYGRISRNVIRKYSRNGAPFFLNISFTAPHNGGPHEPGDPKNTSSPARHPKTIGKFNRSTRRLPDPDGEPGNRRKPATVSGRSKLTKTDKRRAKKVYRQRAEAMSSIDRQVKRLVTTLRRTGELSNTYIMFTADNGYLLGQYRRKQGKTLPYDPSLSTPLAIRGPGIPRGVKRRDPFSTVDFAPTIARMAHTKARGRVDGKPMLGVARNGDRGWKRRPVLTNTGAKKGKKAFGQGIRVNGFLYSEYRSKGRKRELYNLRRDPLALNNVVNRKRYRFTKRRLTKALHRRWDCAGAKCRKPIRKYVR